MSKAGRPHNRSSKEASKQSTWKNKSLLWFELFGHALILIFLIGLVTGRFNSWASLIVYLVIQLIVMIKDRFRTWHAWPFIVGDWRQKRST